MGTPAAVERHEAGWGWLQAGDLRAAERNFDAALKQSVSFYPAEAGLGYVALAKKKPKDSLLHFDRAVVLNPRYAPALGGRAEALLALGEEKEALQSLDAALQADPSLTGLRTRLDVLRFRGQQQDIAAARQLAQSGQLDAARGAYLGAIETSPDSPFLHRELADVERRAGRLDAALEHASRAAALEPDEPRNHVALGEVYEAQGDVAKATEAFTAALALQPDEALMIRVDALRERAAFAAMPPQDPQHRVGASRHPRSARGARRRAARAAAVHRTERQRDRHHGHARPLGFAVHPGGRAGRRDGGLLEPHVPARRHRPPDGYGPCRQPRPGARRAAQPAARGRWRASQRKFPTSAPGT